MRPGGFLYRECKTIEISSQEKMLENAGNAKSLRKFSGKQENSSGQLFGKVRTFREEQTRTNFFWKIRTAPDACYFIVPCVPQFSNSLYVR